MKIKNLTIITVLFTSTFAWGRDRAPSKFDLPVPVGVVPEVIVPKYPEVANEDFTFETAVRICEQYKNLKRGQQYFYVFCNFNWEEKTKKIIGTVDYPDWIKVGTTVTSTDDHYCGFYKTVSSPVFKEVRKTREELFRVERPKLLSMVIWGVGNLASIKPRTLFPTQKTKRLAYDFDEEGEAVLTCAEIRDDFANDPRYEAQYDGSTCDVRQDPANGKYYFLITTQNPFI